MGADPWLEFTPYQRDIAAALRAAQERVHGNAAQQGDSGWPPPAASGGREGLTGSVLDLHGIGTEPDFGLATRFPSALLFELFGTERPTKQQLMDDLSFIEELECGEAAYIVVYDGDGQPTEIAFFGYSFD